MSDLSELSGFTVMVVDDEERIRRLLVERHRGRSD